VPTPNELGEGQEEEKEDLSDVIHYPIIIIINKVRPNVALRCITPGGFAQSPLV
jgi:hypothetical protein